MSAQAGERRAQQSLKCGRCANTLQVHCGSMARTAPRLSLKVVVRSACDHFPAIHLRTVSSLQPSLSLSVFTITVARRALRSGSASQQLSSAIPWQDCAPQLVQRREFFLSSTEQTGGGRVVPAMDAQNLGNARQVQKNGPRVVQFRQKVSSNWLTGSRPLVLHRFFIWIAQDSWSCSDRRPVANPCFLESTPSTPAGTLRGWRLHQQSAL